MNIRQTGRNCATLYLNMSGSRGLWVDRPDLLGRFSVVPRANTFCSEHCSINTGESPHDVITAATPIVGNDPRISAATRLCLPVGPAFCFLVGGGGVRRENSSPGRGTFPTFRSAWDTLGFPWSCNHRLSGLDGSSESISTFLGF